MAYLLDSDVFIQAQNMHYSFTVCPGFWKWIDESHAKGLLFSIKPIRDELLALEDDLSKWVKPRKNLFLDTNDSQTYESQKILSTWAAEHYASAAQTEFFGSGDFRLVAFAHAHAHTVVTHEVPANGFKVKIPNACHAMGVPVINPFKMLEVEGAKFT
jgi:hypothetical protein